MSDKINEYDEKSSSEVNKKIKLTCEADIGIDILPDACYENVDEIEEDNIYSHQHLDFAELRLDDFEKEGDEHNENEGEDYTSDEADDEKTETDTERLRKKGIKRLKAERRLRSYYRSQEKLGLNKLPEPGHAEESTNLSDSRKCVCEKEHAGTESPQETSNKYHESVSPENINPENVKNENISVIQVNADNTDNTGDDTEEGINSYEENGASNSAGIEQDMEYEPYEHFNTYEFGRLAGNLAKGISKNALDTTFSGISGDYSKGSGDVALAAADTLMSAVSEATAGFAKISYNSRIKAAETLEKIRSLKGYADFKPDMLSDNSDSEIKEDVVRIGISDNDTGSFNEHGDVLDESKSETDEGSVKEESIRDRLIREGISGKDIDNLYRHRDVVEDELAIKQLISEKVESGTNEVPEELKKYILKKGFKNLSARSELKLIEILNKENENAQVRNLDFSSLSSGRLKSLKDELSSKNRLDKTSEMLINKAIAAKKREVFEKKDTGLSIRHAYESIRPSKQDLFTGTIKNATESARDTKNNLKFALLTAQTAHALYKKSQEMGNRLAGSIHRTKSAEFKQRSSDFDKAGTEKPRFNRLSGTVKTAKAVSSAKALGSTLVSSSIVSETEDEEKQKKEKRREFVEKTVEGKRITEKFKSKVSGSGFAKQASGVRSNKAAGRAAGTASNKTASKAVKAAGRAGVKEGTKSASFIAKISESAASLISSIPAPVWIAIGIFILILLLVHILKGFAAAEGMGESVSEASEKMISEVTDMADSFTGVMNEINETTILVSSKLTDDEKYVDITDYLIKLQAYDEEREENAIRFAEAPIGSINPESLGLTPYQKNGAAGQNPEVLCGKRITHYGSLDKKNAYTLHYMDAYGNEIANHSTNARDVLTLCAVIFSNYCDDKHVFKYLLEDEWYLLNPKLEWQESEIYCCNTSDAHMEGDTAYYISCDGGIKEGEKYKDSADHFWYCCNDKEATDKVKGYKDAGVKLTGDLRVYDEKGCKKKTESIEFEGDGYDTYDLYLDDYISYDDYLYYVDTYSDEYIITGTFYKDVWYCDGHFINCCFGHKDIDIYITLYDKDYAIANNIYPDPYSSHSGNYDKYLEFLDLFLSDDGFLNEGRIRWADAIYENDWFDIYGIDVFGGAGFEIGGTLTEADIESILGRLPDGELSIIRQAIIEFALRYVGRIPYYFGGKADYLDYEKNNFYSVVEADSKGRTRKGLDCSGFVSWVFANKGISIPSSTAGFSGYVTTRDYTSLKVGDLGFLNKPGAENNHIGIYAGKDENGNDLWIHCNASAGNVSVNNYNGFKYYLSLTD